MATTVSGLAVAAVIVAVACRCPSSIVALVVAGIVAGMGVIVAGVVIIVDAQLPVTGVAVLVA